jgi:hypothetical protein
VLRYHLAALKGDTEQMNQVVALAKGKHGAEHCVAHAEALALARAGRLQAARLSSNTGHGLGPARRATRDGSKLPGGASGVGSRLRKCRRRKKEHHGSALQLSKGREVQYAAGLALAFPGNLLNQRCSPAIWKSASRKMLLSNVPIAPHSVTRKALEIVRSEYSANY